ncbi:hypothetical protein AA101099_0340 [Neoasaia chiangmaiensis NBRC 101099]|uniref:Uncharacterized protein n=1 Tax=Neoasaia chiangmaiensis TaxID=320497 RepID=A0A1U9KRP1_9PROT|nr:hypothetical protein [Neoasaia chiangmaiensis]AQS88534.1 hypothetical protein A0U93_11965 [Neoasaia chiangmaiensis]GBR36371.1 hypothetical protein AA101099_0340 [Neoasaia chiangmaiensis NBRC 101099]GEN15366.1 hypothetical protein NCH01_17970 [Neoasaia chiangmaiensis]
MAIDLQINPADGGPLALRLLEDRVLRLETLSGTLSDQHEQLRAEMRHEILSLRDQMKALESKVEDGNRIVNGKLDRLIGERAVVTGLITLVTSVLGTGAVHIALSMGIH